MQCYSFNFWLPRQPDFFRPVVISLIGIRENVAPLSIGKGSQKIKSGSLFYRGMEPNFEKNRNFTLSKQQLFSYFFWLPREPDFFRPVVQSLIGIREKSGSLLYRRREPKNKSGSLVYRRREPKKLRYLNPPYVRLADLSIGLVFGFCPIKFSLGSPQMQVKFGHEGDPNLRVVGSDPSHIGLSKHIQQIY